MSKKLLINGVEYPQPQDAAHAQELLQTFKRRQSEALKQLHFFALEAQAGKDTYAAAALTDPLSEPYFALLFEVLGAPSFTAAGFLEGVLNSNQVELLRSFLGALASTSNLAASILALLDRSPRVGYALFAKHAADDKLSELFLQNKISTLFELFNLGALRGCDAASRQALLDSFTLLPNRFLSAGGAFIEIGGGGEHFIAGIDKFPSLMSVRGESLAADGNRIVPGAMIRNGVHVGKRNIFMFHSAVNIAAYIGDDNLIDSHASVGSAAQIGSGNKIGSFVSLEGVLSPANAEGVVIGNKNFLGSFVRIGAGISLGNENFIGSGVNLSLGTKIKDCRQGSKTYNSYITCKELNPAFNQLAIAPNNAVREFEGVQLLPGEYILFENGDDFKARFEGDQRIRAK